MKKNNTEDKIACVAVETIGPVKVNKAKWADNSCEVEYTVEGVNQKIQGADCLLRDALYVAKENVTSEIDIEKASKTNDKKVYSRKLDEIINEQTHKIYAMNNRKAQMSEQRRQLAEAERKLANAGPWDSLLDIFGLGSLPEVREKIRNLNAHISSLEGEIAAEERKLNDLRNQKNSTERKIEDVDVKIDALNNIQTWLNKLAGGNTDSKYYRSL